MINNVSYRFQQRAKYSTLKGKQYLLLNGTNYVIINLNVKNKNGQPLDIVPQSYFVHRFPPEVCICMRIIRFEM